MYWMKNANFECTVFEKINEILQAKDISKILGCTSERIKRSETLGKN